MRSLVVYYSQTGNTKKVACAIQRGMSPLLEQCDIASVKEVKPQDVDKYDLIGLGSPVWDGAETPNVRRFIENIPKQQGRHIFSFNTHGVMPEHFFPTVVRRLRGKGFTVIGMRDWYGTAFSACPEPLFYRWASRRIDLKEAEDFGREMVEVSRRISVGKPTSFLRCPHACLRNNCMS